MKFDDFMTECVTLIEANPGSETDLLIRPLFELSHLYQRVFAAHEQVHKSNSVELVSSLLQLHARGFEEQLLTWRQSLPDLLQQNSELRFVPDSTRNMALMSHLKACLA